MPKAHKSSTTKVSNWYNTFITTNHSSVLRNELHAANIWYTTEDRKVYMNMKYVQSPDLNRWSCIIRLICLFTFSNYFLVLGWGLTKTRTGNTQCKWVYIQSMYVLVLMHLTGKWYINNVNYRISLTTKICLLNTKDTTNKKVTFKSKSIFNFES